jgi:hypothetical protein
MTWTSILTPQSLAAGSRRLDRRNALVAYVLAELRRGVSLQCTHTRYGVVWTLSTGHRVAPDIATIVIALAEVKAANDGLFPGMSQSYRATERKR